MTDLTKQWKAGELEEGWYYIKYEDNHVGIAFACEGLGRDEYPFVGFEFEDDIEEVLSPVPSYEELQTLNEKNARQKELIKTLGSDIDYLDTKKMVLIIEVNNLKCLLKECQEHLCHHYSQITVGKLEERIKEVLK